MDIDIRVVYGISGILVGLGVGWGTMVASIKNTSKRLEELKQTHNADIKTVKGCLFNPDGTLIYVPAVDLNKKLDKMNDTLEKLPAHMARVEGFMQRQCSVKNEP